MARARPTVADWLEALRREGLATVDAQMVLDAEQLLAAWSADGGRTVEDAAEGMAARIAAGAGEYRVVRDHFVRTFGGVEGAHGRPEARDGSKVDKASQAPESTAATMPPAAPRWPWFVALTGVMAIGAVLAWEYGGTQHTPSPSEPTEGESDTTTGDSGDSGDSSDPETGATVVLVQPEREVELTASPSPWSWSMLWPALVVASLAVLGLRLLRAGRAPRTRRQAQIARGLAARKRARAHDGPSDGEPYCFKVPPPLDPTAIDAAGDLLGRPGRHELGPRLDVGRTIDRTVRAGGRLAPRFRRSTRPPTLVVLVDIEDRGRAGQAHPLAHAVDWILQRWTSTGLHLLRFDYVDRPDVVWEPDSGRLLRLRDLARRHADARLLVWSRMRRPGQRSERTAWLAGLRPWTRRVWIDLDPRPAKLAGKDVDGRDVDGRDGAELRRLAELEHSGLTRYPLTGQGLVAAARHAVATRGLPPPPRERHPDDERLEHALRQWAAAACCVPDPTWMHLDALRVMLPEVQRVIPEARGVWWLLRWLEDKDCLELPASAALYRLALTEQADATLLRDDLNVELGGHTEGLELWVRARLVEQLEDSEPTTAIERGLRDAKLAYHRWRRDPEGGVADLQGLLGTDADALARRLLARLQHRVDVGGTGGVVARVGEVLGERVAVASVVGLRPRWWEFAVAVGVMAAVSKGAAVDARMEPAEYEVVRPASVETPTRPVPAPTVSSDSSTLPEMETVALKLPEGARPMRLLRVDAGAFWMGSPEDEAEHQPDEQRHRVTITQSFMVCETEVTQAQWMAVMGENPSQRQYGYGSDVAVHDVSWTMAVEFLNALSKLEGRDACYAKDGEDWVWEPSCEGYRLPTEAEWEYATRAGSDAAYSFGDDVKRLADHGWYSPNSNGEAHTVAQKQANGWGLYDVHGNVWESVWDWYESDYGSQATHDPVGPKTGEYRLLRGGAFNDSARWLRSADRDDDDPFIGVPSFGLRCVRGPHPSGRGAP